MRSIVGVGLLVTVLLGCQSTRQPRDDSARGTAPSPRAFPTGPSSSQPERPGREENKAAQVSYNGLLAGRVRDSFDKPMSNGFVQVIDLTDPSSQTKIDVALNDQGEFNIMRLVPGHNYKLTARVQDGSRYMAGVAQATPPKPNVLIWVSEDLVGPDTPPLPNRATLPGQTTDSEKETKPPSAALGAPIKKTDDTVPTDPGSRITPPVVPPVDKTGIVVEPGGFQKKKRDETVDIPSQKEGILPPPPRTPVTPIAPPPKPVGAVPSGADGVPGTPTPVPSCLVDGKRLENFALYNLAGQPWEFKKDRKGRLVMLHFWSSTDAKSLAGLKDVRDLQDKYGPFGLEVVSIAYEQGSWEQQVGNVTSARGRYTFFKSVALLGGGGPKPCPVRQDLAIDQLPALVLIGEDGTIAWRCNTFDADRLAGLRVEIRRRLGVNEP